MAGGGGLARVTGFTVGGVDLVAIVVEDTSGAERSPTIDGATEKGLLDEYGDVAVYAAGVVAFPGALRWKGVGVKVLLLWRLVST